MLRLTLACLFVVACGDDGGNNPGVDATPGPPCTRALYDVCVGNGDCMSNNCHFFNQSNFSACVQACSTTNPCPADSSGNPAACNNMGICKPAAPNNCSL